MKNYIEEVYHTRICHWCRERLKDGDKYYQDYNREVFLCENCKGFLINPPDFDSHGTKEKGTTSWKTANTLTLIRDDCHCRVCGDHWHRENPVEVHHIIPKKDGGTHNLRNLITLCERHHKETFKNGYAGLELIDRQIQRSQKTEYVRSSLAARESRDPLPKTTIQVQHKRDSQSIRQINEPGAANPQVQRSTWNLAVDEQQEKNQTLHTTIGSRTHGTANEPLPRNVDDLSSRTFGEASIIQYFNHVF